MADELCIETGDELYLLERVYLSNLNPIAIARNYLIPRLVPNLPGDYSSITSLYKYLEEDWGLTIESAFDRITARAASLEEAGILNIEPGAPLLIDHRVSNTMGAPLEAVDLIIDAASYEFSIFMTSRPGR
jgi:GntR family transcriptional regulator